MKHPIEVKIQEFIESSPTQPTFAEFMEHFKNQPRILEYMVIASLYIDYDADGIIKENFKSCKDSEKIESLIEEYGEYGELAEMFIPDNLVAASLYKDFKELNKAQDIITRLLDSDYADYYQEIFLIKDLLFTGQINLEIKNCPMDTFKIIDFLEDKMDKAELESLQDGDNLLNFDNFLFYHLHLFSHIQDYQEVKEIISSYIKKRDMELNPINQFSCFLSGQLEEDSVHFKVNIHGLKNLVNGMEVTKIKIKTDIKEILKGFGSDVLKDKASEAITEYLVDKIPLVKEVKIGKDLLQAFFSNMFEMADVSFLMKEFNNHKENILELNLSIKDYYTGHFLTHEFQTFFKENNLEYVEGELLPVYNRLYNSFIQSVNSLLTPELEKELIEDNLFYADYDIDTKKFLSICDHLNHSTFPRTRIGFAQFR